MGVASLVVFVICWIIVNVAIFSYEAYWMHQFWGNRRALILSKRYPTMILIQQLCLWIFTLCCFTTIGVIFEIETADNITSSSGWSMETSTFIICLVTVLISPFYYIGSLYFVSRYWLIFYIVNYNSAIKNNKWQSVINPQSADENWYLLHRNTYGSWPYLRYRIFVLCIFLYVLTLLLWIPSVILYSMNDIKLYNILWNIIFYNLWITSFFSTTIIPLFFYIYMLCSLPSINDNIGIRSELRFSASVQLSFVILFPIFAIFISIMIRNNINFQFLTYIFFVFLRILLAISNWKNTVWPLKTFRDIFSRYSSRKLAELAHQNTYNKIELHLNNVLNDETTLDAEHIHSRIEMRKILSENSYFDAFMRQLLNEYCAECLLSIIEFLQFKKKIVLDNDNDNNIDESDVLNVILLPKECPQSCIVFDGDTDDNYKLMAIKLYEKYICVGSKYEINIDSANKSKYTELMCNKNNWNNNEIYNNDINKLYILFNPCIDHMMRLISASFARFQESKEYNLIHNGHQKKNTLQVIKKSLNILQSSLSTSYGNKDDLISVVSISKSGSENK